jgi:hypothetical protein
MMEVHLKIETIFRQVVYTVVATDAGNCTASKQITITQPSCALVLSEVHTNVTIANGSDGSIDITQTGGYAPVTYLWDTESTDEDRTGLIAGTYVVTVADAGGCSASLQVVIFATRM